MFLVYGFLAMIALVTLLNIMNSMSMSVSARLNQYGAMRAVGMDEYQMIKMIAAEALTYSISGCIVGLTAGLALNKLLYDRLITTHFAYATWSIPIEAILVIGLVILLATFAAIYAPAKKIQQMAVTEVINEL
jgi:ABC-type antimicrobial peptide transport system permease subunit